jgi:hypothetical protein
MLTDREIANMNAWAAAVGKQLSLMGLHELLGEIEAAVGAVEEGDERTELLVLATIYREEIERRETP